MKGEHHEQAKRLLDASAVEGISGADQTWLDAHLESCPGCAAYGESVRRAVSALRSLSVALDPAVVEATRWRVHFRARELRKHEARTQALWFSCALSWVLGAVTAPLLWQATAWLGHRLDLSASISITLFAFTWVVPATLVGAAVAWWRMRSTNWARYAGDRAE
ncbi:MAG: zf-HC2 domain-containing protein [Terriglobia bacterium]|jgi:anti-sigma factor RsiW